MEEMNKLINIFEKVKKAKGYYAIFIPNKGIICTDENFTYIKCIDIDIDFKYNIFLCNKIVTKIMKDPCFKYNEQLHELYYTDDGLEKIYSLNDMYSFNKIFQMYLSTINYISNSDIIYQNENIREEEQFEQALTLKSKQGIGFFKINKEYILTLFSGLLPINKNDKVSLNINSMAIHNTFIASFKIIKKGMTIDVYIKYLKI